MVCIDEEPMEWIEWDDLESAYLTNRGETYKKIEHIPAEYHHLVKSVPNIPCRFRMTPKGRRKQYVKSLQNNTLYSIKCTSPQS